MIKTLSAHALERTGGRAASQREELLASQQSAAHGSTRRRKATAETILNYSGELLASPRDTGIIGKANQVNMVRKKSLDFEDTEGKGQNRG